MSKTTCDLCDEFSGTIQVADSVLRHFGGRTQFSGRISPIKCHEDNSRVREAVDRDGDDQVLVVDGGGSLRCALVGDQLAAKAISNGWHGIIVFGAVRDLEVLATLNIGIMALGHHPMRSVKNGAGQSGVAVNFAGVNFAPGHFIYADLNGIVVAANALY